jgi:hypothetical protein
VPRPASRSRPDARAARASAAPCPTVRWFGVRSATRGRGDPRRRGASGARDPSVRGSRQRTPHRQTHRASSTSTRRGSPSHTSTWSLTPSAPRSERSCWTSRSSNAPSSHRSVNTRTFPTHPPRGRDRSLRVPPRAACRLRAGGGGCARPPTPALRPRGDKGRREQGSRDPREAEPEALVAVAGRVPGAVRHPRDRGGAVPAPTPEDPVQDSGWTRRVRRRALGPAPSTRCLAIRYSLSIAWSWDDRVSGGSLFVIGCPGRHPDLADEGRGYSAGTTRASRPPPPSGLDEAPGPPARSALGVPDALSQGLSPSDRGAPKRITHRQTPCIPPSAHEGTRDEGNKGQGTLARRNPRNG